ncbi:MAG: hypothetical protein JSR37_07710 [Verrucomicrobia bacterium]|nr:hypothetical protein [Verrucomicrobiota bacterium]MBS0637405.1 hypothetical protein [Verrucomicrobiota bacterium]
MPFITIEMPKSVNFELAPFAEAMHGHISQSLDVPIEKLKTKLVKLDEVFVGVGDPAHTYAHMEIALMHGRDRQKLRACIDELLMRFKEAIKKQNPDLQCRITVGVHELDKELLVV